MALYNENAPVAFFTPTGNVLIDSLADPSAGYWSTVSGGKTQISYSYPFLDGVASKFTYELDGTQVGVTAAQATAIDLAFQRWADVANIQFTRITETADGVVGDIRVNFGSTDIYTAAYAYYPGGGGDITYSKVFTSSTFQV